MKHVQDIQMHGAGNRFLLHFGDSAPAKLVRGLGECDGLLIVQHDESVEARMRIFNADGSEAQQCGNGLRCVALHLIRSRCVEGPSLKIRTLAGVHTCLVHEERNEVEVTLCKAVCGPDSCQVSPTALSDLPELTFVNVGNPNAVLWTRDDPIEVREKWGEVLVQHPAFQEGINLHVARLDGKQFATCASWERGVGATLASGTGGASVFIASESQEIFYVSSLGGTLSYYYDDKGRIVMCGPAGYV